MRRILLLFLLVLAACKARGPAEVQGVLLAQADGVSEVPEGGALLVIGQVPKALDLPTDKRIRLALSWDLKWSVVRDILATLKAADREVTLLVGQRYHVRGLRLQDTLESKRRIHVYAQEAGKACVQAPGVEQAKCVQSFDKKYIDRAGVREVVREAVKALDLRDVEVEVTPDLLWGDVVRLIDGTRTCCGKDTVRVGLSAASLDSVNL